MRKKKKKKKKKKKEEKKTAEWRLVGRRSSPEVVLSALGVPLFGHLLGTHVRRLPARVRPPFATYDLAHLQRPETRESRTRDNQKTVYNPFANTYLQMQN